MLIMYSREMYEHNYFYFCHLFPYMGWDVQPFLVMDEIWEKYTEAWQKFQARDQMIWLSAS